MRKSATSTVIAASFGMLMAVSAVVAAPQAQADPGFCKDGRVCIWENSSYGGRSVSYRGPANVPNVGDYMNDKTTSIWNRTDQAVCFFDSSNFGEAPIVNVGPGSSTAAVASDVNDRITSLRACTGADG